MGEADAMELIYSLVGYPDETEWIEFKSGNNDPERIGCDISALANAAAYHGRECAYKIWGVEDGSHALIGTSFNPYHAKGKGNQDLLIWLRQFVSQNANYEFELIEHESKLFVVLRIRAAHAQPVCFSNVAYIREGSSTTKLASGSAKEAELWRRLQSVDFETLIAQKDVLLSDIGDLLDIEAYFSLLGEKVPTTAESVAAAFQEQDLIKKQDNGRYSVTNLAALLVGKSLSAFSGLRKRALRVVEYDGKGNFGILEDKQFDCGYALALPQAEKHIMAKIPSEEYVEGAFRKVRAKYPQRAVRELLSNAVIHQDLSDATSGPLVGLYSNRIEFSNPGALLIPANRVLNAQPKTRNGMLAAILRLMDLCEEGGTGWDLTVAACEAARMAAPKIESEENLGTKVTLFADCAYDRMPKAERKDAVYWHACLMYAQGESMGNQSLRERFGLDASKKNLVAISRLLKECCEEGFVKEEDKEAGAKFRRYIPFWA